MHEFGAGTHVGNIRDNNEDSYVCDPRNDLWIVADGMGGLGLGEVASAISTYTVAQQVKNGHGINQAIELAHKQIKEYARIEASGTNMGTTMALLLTNGSLYNIFWVGDSRAYLFDKGRISQLTTDHSLVQSLIEQGEITPEEAISDPRKNVVTRALGVQEMETVRADSISEKWQPGQKILLCSDGLTDCVRSEKIEAILCKETSDQEKVDLLIQAALDGGGHDNITIVLVSASNLAGKVESDTHVPGTEDKTLVPSSEPTQRNYHRGATHQSVGKNQLRPQEAQSEQEDSDKNRWSAISGLRGWLTAFATVALLVVFTRMSTADKSEVASTAANQLLSLNTETSVPLARRGIPNMDAPEGGKVIQLGLFNLLEGAEVKQQQLARLGHVPFIEKKVTSDAVQYAVLLGPYYSDVQSQKISSALSDADIGHFERPESHY